MSNLPWPQIIMVGIYILGVVGAFRKHGAPKTGKHNFWAAVIGTLLGAAILYWGGFFGGGCYPTLEGAIPSE